MLEKTDQVNHKESGQKVENDPFNVDVRELKTTSLNKEPHKEATWLTTVIPLSVIKYSVLLKC